MVSKKYTVYWKATVYARRDIFAADKKSAKKKALKLQPIELDSDGKIFLEDLEGQGFGAEWKLSNVEDYRE